MIITKLSSGFGNQMFQYAAGKALALKWKEKLLLDISYFLDATSNVDGRAYGLDIFKNIKPDYTSRFLSDGFYMYSRWDNRLRNFLKLKRRVVMKEENYLFNKDFENIQPSVLLHGYWQSEKYFKTYEKEIRNDFEFPAFEPADPNGEVLRDILSSKSVSVHVRRGDYVNLSMFSGIATPEYFRRAIAYVASKYPDSKFFFFSDDPAWVEENLMGSMHARIVTGNHGDQSWKDMALMNSCQNHILSNSSFSWWGAWLNKNKEKIVVTPDRWFATNDPHYEPNEIVPQNWLRL